MATPRRYQISVPQSKVDLLKQKLALAEFPSSIEPSEWCRGPPLANMQRLAKVWETWDWRAAEKKLNAFPHFMSDIEVRGFGEIETHFIHQKSENPNSIPLLFVHGWPGSFIEVLKLLPLLAACGPGEPSFHVVAPSLPNYGFTQRINKSGFAASQHAELCHKLMLQLGYDEYVTQGGDWGFFITRAIGTLYPESCKASHINMVVSDPPKFRSNPLVALQNSITPFSQRDKSGFKRTNWFSAEGSGYFKEQSTKPQTLSYALTDSPVALLAWIYEKLHLWTDDYAWTDDEVLTWISIYAFSRAGPGAAHEIYWEVQHTNDNSIPDGIKGKIFRREDAQSYIKDVKLGVTHNPQELLVHPKLWARTLGDLVYEAENEHGGHFYAHEHPELLARDLKTMFGKEGGAYGVLRGKNGYDTMPTSKL